MRFPIPARLAAAMCATLLAADPAFADLVALYQFDETSGVIAKDSAQNDGIHSGVVSQGAAGWTTGLIGGAIDLDGATSLLAPDALGADATAFTISAWVNMDDAPAYDGIFVARNSTGNWGLNIRGGTEDPQNLRYEMRWSNSGQSNSQGRDTGAMSAQIGQWQHIAMTWDSTLELKGKVYLNGQFVQDGPFGLEDTFDAAGEMWHIGDDPCCGGRELDGQLDDLAVWNEELSATDIQTIYDNGLLGIGITPPPRIGLPGDVNGDELVNSADFETIRQNLFQPFTEISDGDLINDDFVDFVDYGDWKQVSPKDPDAAFGQVDATPEPAAAVLLVLAAAAPFARRSPRV